MSILWEKQRLDMMKEVPLLGSTYVFCQNPGWFESILALRSVRLVSFSLHLGSQGLYIIIYPDNGTEFLKKKEKVKEIEKIKNKNQIMIVKNQEEIFDKLNFYFLNHSVVSGC